MKTVWIVLKMEFTSDKTQVLQGFESEQDAINLAQDKYFSVDNKCSLTGYPLFVYKVQEIPVQLKED